MTKLDVKSLFEFIKDIRALQQHPTNPRPTTFRGQRLGIDVWPLLPKLTRVPRRGGLPRPEVLQVERKFVEEFRRRLRSRPADQIDDWDATITGRHHLLPTRLLDWTASPLVALYFSVLDDQATTPNSQNDSFVYATHGERVFDGPLRAKFPSPWDVVLASTEPQCLFFIPDYISPRVFAQQSVLSVWGEPQKPFEQLVQPGDFWEFRVPWNLRAPIRADLDAMGINEETLYPDLDGTARYLDWKCEKEQWTDKGFSFP